MRSTSNPLTSIQRIAGEAFFLILAVLFALAVDEAWEDHEYNEAAVHALSRIHQELDKNSKLIQDENEQHKLELERIQSLIGQINSEISLPADFDTSVKIHISILRDTAWRSAQFADVLKYVPYEQIQSVTAAYSLQELYINQTSKAFNFQGDVNFIQAVPAVQLRSSFEILSKLYAIEHALLSAYGQVGAETESVAQ